MKKVELNRVHIEKTIRDNGYLYFGVQFKKKNGEMRTMSARLGVKKGLKGGKNKVVSPKNAYMTVFDNNAKGFRTINLATVQKMKIRGTEYKIV